MYNELIRKYKKLYEKEPKLDKNDAWKQKYNPKEIKNINYQPIKLETELMTDEDESGIKQATKSKPLWIDLSRKDFE